MPRIRLKDALTGAALALSVAANAAAAPDTARAVQSKALPNAPGKVSRAAVPATPASAERAAPSAVVPPEGVRERDRAATPGPTGKDLVPGLYRVPCQIGDNRRRYDMDMCLSTDNAFRIDCRLGGHDDGCAINWRRVLLTVGA